MTAFHAVPPAAVKIALNNIFSGFAACAAFCGAIKRFNRFIENKYKSSLFDGYHFTKLKETVQGQKGDT